MTELLLIKDMFCVKLPNNPQNKSEETAFLKAYFPPSDLLSLICLVQM